MPPFGTGMPLSWNSAVVRHVPNVLVGVRCWRQKLCEANCLSISVFVLVLLASSARCMSYKKECALRTCTSIPHVSHVYRFVAYPAL